MSERAPGDGSAGLAGPRSPLHHIPNLLCVFRIILVAPLLWLLVGGQHLLALLLFMLAGFTDGLDGFLAKHFGWRTRLGAFLDPAADKFLLVGVFVTLGVLDMVPLWLVGTVLLRDVVIVIGALAYRVFVGPFDGEARPASKLNTATQLLFVLLVLSNAALALPSREVLTVLGATVFATAVVSGVDYVWTWGRRAWRVSHGESA